MFSQKIRFFTAAAVAFVIVFCAVFCAVLPFVKNTAVAGAVRTASITENGDGELVLSWSPYDGEKEGYVVYLNDVLLGATDAYTAYLNVDAALTLGGKYAFKIYTTVDGAETNLVACDYDRYVNLNTVTALRMNGTLVLWDAVRGAVGYRVYAEGIFLSSVSSASFDAAEYLVESKDYGFAVVPYGENSYYVSPDYSTLKLTYAASENGSGADIFISYFGGKLYASWQPLTAAKSYLYVLSDGTSPNSTSLTAADVTDLANGETHTLTVYAIDGGGRKMLLGSRTFKVTNGEVQYA